MKLYSHYKNNINSYIKSDVSWENHSINNSLLYSYRKNSYDAGSFPSNLHYHDYYELIIIEQGNIKYICESQIYYPQKGDIILIPPGKFHMSAITDKTTLYERHVFYFFPNAFDNIGCEYLCTFAKKQQNAVMFTLSDIQKEKLRNILDQLNSTISSSDQMSNALGISYTLQFFCLINKQNVQISIESSDLPESILKLKNYIDNNYAEITSSSQIAEHFFYSREHASKLFRKYFDITISDYILKRRILESQKMILDGCSITDSAYATGFNSMSAFIRGFRKINGISPSEYRKRNIM